MSDPQAGMSLADRVRSIHHAFNRGDNRKADVIALGDKVAELEGLLVRAVKYAVEDRAFTPGSTRLARLLLEARRFLGIPDGPQDHRHGIGPCLPPCPGYKDPGP